VWLLCVMTLDVQIAPPQINLNYDCCQLNEDVILRFLWPSRKLRAPWLFTIIRWRKWLKNILQEFSNDNICQAKLLGKLAKEIPRLLLWHFNCMCLGLYVCIWNRYSLFTFLYKHVQIANKSLDQISPQIV